MMIRVRTLPHRGRFLGCPRYSITTHPVTMSSVQVTRAHHAWSGIFRSNWWRGGLGGRFVIHPGTNDYRVRPSKRGPGGGRRRRSAVETVIVAGRWWGRICHIRGLLLGSVDCQRLLDLLVLFPLLLALNCPTPLYPFHLLTTPAVTQRVITGDEQSALKTQ